MPVVEPTTVFTDPEPTCQFDMDPDPTVPYYVHMLSLPTDTLPA
jgi:hypothetical protein